LNLKGWPMLWETSDALSLSDYPPESNLPEIAPHGAASGTARTVPDESAAAEPEYLSDYSRKDRPWDEHRGQADDVEAIYSSARGSVWFSRLGERMKVCSPVLGFAWAPEKDDPAVLGLKLRDAHFCRVRHCPVCQWRRSLMWSARFLQAMPRVLAEYPKARFIFLTLTLKNVAVNELRVTCSQMSRAWGRLCKRKEFVAVLGWLRAVEVTRGENGSAHPHCHVLMMVSEDYFHKSDKYMTHAEWRQAWRESLRLDYDPQVRVRAVAKRGMSAKGQNDDPLSGLLNAARETLKYCVKPSDMTADPSWFLELTRQVHNLKFVTTGGVLKGMLQESQETDEDLILLGDGAADEESPKLYFGWRRPVRRYKRQRGGRFNDA
jgi:plasmid rolling circle replication initiator protein Rep